VIEETRPVGRLVAIVGPTAVGKSALALALAERLPRMHGGRVEIVSADSRQVYRGLDVGTAKPTPEERCRVIHHLIDVVEPEDDFSLAEFQDRAYLAIDDVLRRGGIPLLVGGTGLYVRAVVDGVSLPRVAPDRALRAELEDFARQRGADELHRRLAAVDPLAARRIDPRNVRRVIRALEVVRTTGTPFSTGTTPRPRYDVLTIGLTANRDALYRRIDERIERQVADGLLDETHAVLARGCPPTRPALRGLVYREMVAYLQGDLDLPSAMQRAKFETHRFARQQYAWFRLDDARIHWLESTGRDAGSAIDRATDLILRFEAPASRRSTGVRL
jgi:tRNA dimethylallyltransferase